MQDTVDSGARTGFSMSVGFDAMVALQFSAFRLPAGLRIEDDMADRTYSNVLGNPEATLHPTEPLHPRFCRRIGDHPPRTLMCTL